jgi:flagellum-specific peptidoglycan hydrolase FlgJ
VTEDTHNAQLALGNSEVAPRAFGPDSRFNIQDTRSQAPDSSSDTPDSQFRIPHLSSQQLQFLLRVAPGALESERVYEVPACVTLAQAILESATSAGWGTSSLFRIANNPFGIKFSHRAIGSSDHRVIGKSLDREIGRSGDRAIGKPTAPPEQADQSVAELATRGSASPQITGARDHPISRSTELPIPGSGSPAPSPEHPAPAPAPYGAFDAQTWEIENGQKKVMIARFQRFPNLTEAFKAHAQLLCSPRYRPAFAVRHDWKQFAERLGPKTSPLDSEHCGYSTNPSYSAELIKLVELYRLDDPRAVEWYATGKDPGHGASTDRIIGSSGHRVIENPAGPEDELVKSGHCTS